MTPVSQHAGFVARVPQGAFGRRSDWLLPVTLTTQFSPWDRRNLAGWIGDLETRSE